MNGLSIGSYESGKFVVITLTGEIDISNAKYLQTSVLATSDVSSADVVVDLSGVPFLDSSGVNSLIRIYKELKTKSGSLAVAGPTDQVRQAFSYMALDKIISISDSVEAATS